MDTKFITMPIMPLDALTVTPCKTATISDMSMPAMGPYMKVPISMGTSAGEYSKNVAAGHGPRAKQANITANAHKTPMPQSCDVLILLGLRRADLARFATDLPFASHKKTSKCLLLQGAQKRLFCTSSIRTIPSVREFHPIGLQSKFADYTAGEEFHLAPKR